MKKNAFVKDFEDELRLFSIHEENIKNINEELEYIDSKIYSVKNANPTSYKTGEGDINTIEDKLINLLAKQDRLTKQLMIIKNEHSRVKKILSCLNEEEYKILDLRFFKNYKFEKLEKLLFKDKANISREIDRILLKVLEKRYGKLI